MTRLGGSNLQKRFQIAHRLYGTKPVDQMTPAEVAGFYDQYCHPHKSDHTIGEILGWFDDQGLRYWGAYPPLRVDDFIGMAQYRGSLAEQHPYFHTGLARKIVMMSSRLPATGSRTPPYTRPTMMDRFVWQAAYALQGSRGRYSGGPALCARKGNRQTDAPAGLTLNS